ncbi:MAG: class I tRNA ligase family protein, partial [Candidatus Nanohaloarchaea archaeon]|nr:class I tRNA ligase family protein [Candidatus Nanohaloarchaea archaeon]
RMLDENTDVDWIPEHVGEKRFRNFVEDSPDWCISRQNYWGVPIPIWICNDCGDEVVIGSFEELEEHVGELPDNFDPHKHVVDDLTWTCDCGGMYERIDDILDVWFDSGCAPFASLHYPFEEEPLESMWPMDFITEASDQIRGWFYSLMFCGILGFDEAPYEKILFQGHVLDAEGKKMSKSLGNVIDPQEQVEEYGADLPRFYTVRVAAPWEQTKYDESEIEEEIYRLFSVYWNTKEFYETHGHEVGEMYEDELYPEDRWILSRLNTLVNEAVDMMDRCRFHRFARELEDFILEDVSRWYVKKVRSRVKDGDDAASWTLRRVIDTTNLLLAPFAPHLAEKVYQDLGGEEDSVHMVEYPEPETDRIDEPLEESMSLAREVVEQVIRLRDREEYNLRWPARRLVIATDDETALRLRDLEDLIADMANVKEVAFGEVTKQLVAEPDYSRLGPKFGENAEEVAQKIEELDHDQVEQLQETGEIVIDGYDVELEDVEVRSETEEDVGSMDFERGQLYLDLHMTDEIEDEALVREVVRTVQQRRKEAGLDVDDAVTLRFAGTTDAIETHEELVRDRVTVDEIVYGGEELKYADTVSFRGRDVEFSFSEPEG